MLFLSLTISPCRGWRISVFCNQFAIVDRSCEHPIDNHTAMVRFFSTITYLCKIIKAVFKRQNGTEIKSLKQVSRITIIYVFYNCLTWNLFFPLRYSCPNSITCSSTRCIQQFRFFTEFSVGMHTRLLKQPSSIHVS